MKITHILLFGAITNCISWEASAYQNNPQFSPQFNYYQEQTYWNTLRIQQELERQRIQVEQQERDWRQQERTRLLMESFPDRYNTDIPRW
jgi:hypothetical protein